MFAEPSHSRSDMYAFAASVVAKAKKRASSPGGWRQGNISTINKENTVVLSGLFGLEADEHKDNYDEYH